MTNMTKKYLYGILYILIILLLFSLIINTLYYFDLINNNLIRYFKMLGIIISFFIGGIYIGINSPNKGYLYGLKLSGMMTIVLLIFSIIFNSLNLRSTIYYLITTVCITFGSMIGINKKKG